MSDKAEPKLGSGLDRGTPARPGARAGHSRKPSRGDQGDAARVLRMFPKWIYDLRWLFGYAMFLAVATYATKMTGWDKGAVKSLHEFAFYGLIVVICPGVAMALLDKMLSRKAAAAQTARDPEQGGEERGG